MDGYTDSGLELDESDVWSSVGGGGVSLNYRKSVVSSRKKSLAATKRAEAVVGGTASSLPVNIPDWAKILKEATRTSGAGTSTMMWTARISDPISEFRTSLTKQLLLPLFSREQHHPIILILQTYASYPENCGKSFLGKEFSGLLALWTEELKATDSAQRSQAKFDVGFRLG
ncbi:hypothetical protein RJ640_013661 [Escallonia rubra]|uniref:Uncharacterized protein n=1 Tax=Escallonia rubra TaxID=112253 RepID=A0AA88QYT6_9ASTE|nr:hypothetical protein RJ640_013661 [Escallonia rubra]